MQENELDPTAGETSEWDRERERTKDETGNLSLVAEKFSMYIKRKIWGHLTERFIKMLGTSYAHGMVTFTK